MGKLGWGSILILMLAPAFFACATTKAAPKQPPSTTAAGDPEVSKPSTAPEYLQMVKTLADWDNRKLANSKSLFVTNSSGEIVEAPEKTPLRQLPHFRAPTAAEIEKMESLWPKVPLEKNAAYYFFKAILAQPDAKEAPAGSATSLHPYGGDIEALANWVTRNSPVLEATRAGMMQDVYCVPLEISDQTGAPMQPLSFFSGLRQIARDLMDAGFIEEVKGNPDSAATYYLECVRFGKSFHNATAIECLVGVSVQGKGQTALDSLIANATLSDETLRGLILACREGEVAQDAPARILAANSALVEAQAALAKAPWRHDPTMLLDLRSANALKEFSARKRLDELLQKKAMEAACAHELKEYAGKENQASALPRTFVELGQTNVRLRQTQIRAAITLYQKATGRVPDGLNALCPDILPSAPIDPFSGKSMRYIKTADGWKVWSVGPDNVDNGGEAVTYVPKKDSHTVIFNDIFTSQVRSNIDLRSKGASNIPPAP